eukprot:1161875-Pelagomonas_calceolata.AAC.17
MLFPSILRFLWKHEIDTSELSTWLSVGIYTSLALRECCCHEEVAFYKADNGTSKNKACELEDRHWKTPALSKHVGQLQLFVLPSSSLLQVMCSHTTRAQVYPA